MLKMSFFSKFLVVLILLNFFFYNLSSSSKETIYLSYKEFLDKFPDGYPKFIGMGNPKSIGAFKTYLHEFGYKSFDYEGNSIEKISNHASYTFLYVLQTLQMFLVFPHLINKFGFYWAIFLSVILTTFFIFVVHFLSKKYGYNIL